MINTGKNTRKVRALENAFWVNTYFLIYKIMSSPYFPSLLWKSIKHWRLPSFSPPGGDWIFDMISADWVRYPNMSKWLEVADHHVAIEHANIPHFFMRVEFESIGEDTRLTWTGIFDSDTMYEWLNTSSSMPMNKISIDSKHLSEA